MLESLIQTDLDGANEAPRLVGWSCLLGKNHCLDIPPLLSIIRTFTFCGELPSSDNLRNVAYAVLLRGKANRGDFTTQSLRGVVAVHCLRHGFCCAVAAQRRIWI